MKRILIDETRKKKELGDLFGLFFEDLNHAADGGMYGELVQNRSFEFCQIDRAEYHGLTAWEKGGGLFWEIRTEEPLNAENQHYLYVKAQTGGYIANCGYNDGIYVEKGKSYDFSLWARCPEGTKAELTVGVAEFAGAGASGSRAEAVGAGAPDSRSEAVEARASGSRAEAVEAGAPDSRSEAVGTSASGNTPDSMEAAVNPEGAALWKECAHGQLTVDGVGWRKYELSLKASDTTCRGRLYLKFREAGSCEFDMISLFPHDTFRGRRNGMRADIAQALCDMKPKFMRFPGGCLTHVGSLDAEARDSMYRWKKTVGPVEERPARRNSWGYNQSFGIGYYEYFLFCEDIGAKPLPVLPGGFNPHTGEGVPLEDIGQWVQETLDLIEFANGGPDTKWGGIRAKMGHEQPFGLEYLAIGNEEIGDGFYERYPYFHNAIREKAPEIKIINSAGPFPVGEGYEAGWTSAKKYGSDLIDEHYYSSPEWFLANMHHYEDYDENGPKVFLGEYASWGNTYYNALVEAAYMTHLERSPAVGLACYAPMLCNADYVNWKPDMLWFDNHRILKTANYYVQKLFMEYQGTDEVELVMEGLDEVMSLTERESLDGKLTIQGNDIAGKLWDVRIMGADGGPLVRASDLTADGGKAVKAWGLTADGGHAPESPDFIANGDNMAELPDFTVAENNVEHILAHMDSRHYGLEFTFRRSKGRKGLNITFGKRDEKNYLRWEFGGWDNWDCNLTAVENGRGSVISHRIFRVGDGEYRLKLEVDGFHIRTWVNGEKFNDTVYRLPELEELYAAASTDRETGRIFFKAVNLTGEEKRVELHVIGEPKSKMTELCLKGHGLTEENTFDTPDKIIPVEKSRNITENQMLHVFPPHSFTVLVFE